MTIEELHEELSEIMKDNPDEVKSIVVIRSPFDETQRGVKSMRLSIGGFLEITHSCECGWPDCPECNPREPQDL